MKRFLQEKLSVLYREKQKSENKILNFDLEVNVESYRRTKMKFKNFGWMDNYDFYDIVKKKSNIISVLKQPVNNNLYWSTEYFECKIKLVEDEKFI